MIYISVMLVIIFLKTAHLFMYSYHWGSCKSSYKCELSYITSSIASLGCFSLEKKHQISVCVNILCQKHRMSGTDLKPEGTETHIPKYLHFITNHHRKALLISKKLYITSSRYLRLWNCFKIKYNFILRTYNTGTYCKQQKTTYCKQQKTRLNINLHSPPPFL